MQLVFFYFTFLTNKGEFYHWSLYKQGEDVNLLTSLEATTNQERNVFGREEISNCALGTPRHTHLPHYPCDKINKRVSLMPNKSSGIHISTLTKTRQSWSQSMVGVACHTLTRSGVFSLPLDLHQECFPFSLEHDTKDKHLECCLSSVCKEQAKTNPPHTISSSLHP